MAATINCLFALILVAAMAYFIASRNCFNILDMLCAVVLCAIPPALFLSAANLQNLAGASNSIVLPIAIMSTTPFIAGCGWGKFASRRLGVETLPLTFLLMLTGCSFFAGGMTIPYALAAVSRWPETRTECLISLPLALLTLPAIFIQYRCRPLSLAPRKAARSRDSASTDN